MVREIQERSCKIPAFLSGTSRQLRDFAAVGGMCTKPASILLKTHLEKSLVWDCIFRCRRSACICNSSTRASLIRQNQCSKGRDRSTTRKHLLFSGDNQPTTAPSLKMGRYMPTTMPPTNIPMMTMMNGSSRLANASTALLTSCS